MDFDHTIWYYDRCTRVGLKQLDSEMWSPEAAFSPPLKYNIIIYNKKYCKNL